MYKTYEEKAIKDHVKWGSKTSQTFGGQIANILLAALVSGTAMPSGVMTEQ